MARKISHKTFRLSTTIKAVLLLTLCLLGRNSALDDDNFTLKYEGDVHIGVLVNLHHGPHIATSNDVTGNCGIINIDSVQQVVAAKWAVDVINNQSLPHELKIGLQIHDTCNRDDLTQKHLYKVISTTQDLEKSLGITKSGPPILGMIGIGEPASLSETTGALHAFNIPLISVAPDPSDQSLGAKFSNVLTTAPDMAGQARALVNIAYEMNTATLSIMSSSRSTIDTFLSEATALGIRVPHVLEYQPHLPDLPKKVESFLRKLPGKRPMVVLISEAGEAVTIAEHLKHVALPNDPIWLVGSLGLDLRTLSGWRKVFHGGLFVEPHMPELGEFKDFFIRALQAPDEKLGEVISEYKEEVFGCGHGQAGQSSLLVPCDSVSKNDIELRFQQDPHVSFVVKAVSALTAAFRLVQLDHCQQAVNSACLKQINPDLHEDILDNLKKLSFTSVPGSAMEVEGTQHHFTRNGKLVANKQLVFQIDEREGTHQIGWYSEDEGLHIDSDLHLEVDAVDVSSKEQNTERVAPVSSPLVVNQDRSIFGRSIGNADLNAEQSSLDRFNSEEKFPVFSYESFISRTWSLVVLAVTILGACICLWMMIYVFIKMCDGTLNGNQTMGILLLIGILCLFASVVPWLLPPNETVCANRHFLHPIAMVLCFAILLVKAMQLRSLVSVGLGGTIPHINQIVSLLFMLLVQVVIAIEWYISSSPLGIQLTDGYPECSVSKNRFLLLHVYPCTLLLLALVYGVSVIKIKRNFNEGRWITFAAVFCVPVFAAWPVVYYFAPVQYHDPSVAVSIVSIAGILLSAVFFPKMHTIAIQSKSKPDDMQRSHSDSTVFTGFSDYLQNFGGKSNTENVFPIYGNYHPHSHYMSSPVQHPPVPPNYPPPPVPSNPNQYVSMHPGPFQFNGLNYVQRPTKRSSRQPMTTYAEWTRELAPEVQEKPKRVRKRHDSEKSANEKKESKQRSRSLSREGRKHHRHQHEQEEEEEGNYSTITPPTSNVHEARSQSPSDGMILTPSGLILPSNAHGSRVALKGRGHTGLLVGGTANHLFHRHQHQHQHQHHPHFHFHQPDLYLSTAT